MIKNRRGEPVSLLARNILLRRDELGIKSNTELARLAGVNRSVIANIIGIPKKSIMADYAIALSTALQCRTKWLMTGEGIKESVVSQTEYALDKGAPVISLSDLKGQDIEEYVTSIPQKGTHKRYYSPLGDGRTSFAVFSQEDIQMHPLGTLLFFSFSVAASNGDIVLVRMSEHAEPEIYIFHSHKGTVYLESVNKTIPDNVRTFAIEPGMDIIATCTSSVNILKKA